MNKVKPISVYTDTLGRTHFGLLFRWPGDPCENRFNTFVVSYSVTTSHTQFGLMWPHKQPTSVCMSVCVSAIRGIVYLYGDIIIAFSFDMRVSFSFHQSKSFVKSLG